MPQTAQDRLSPQQFRRLASFIEDYSGIKMPPVKKVMVEGRLRRRVNILGLSSLNAYCDHLFDHGDLENEIIHLIDAVTTNKTEFFREPQHFRFLVEQGLPALAKAGAGSSQPLRAWSAACSTGAEPYTLAMVLNEFGAAYRGYRYSILATDICTDVLDKALTGIYPEEMSEPVPEALRKRYFLRSRDRSKRDVRIVPALRAQVRFARLNLMEETYGVSDMMDIILCRNILIYFDKPTQEMVLQRLCRHLRQGGYLIIGHSEATAGFTLPLRSVAPTVFMRE
ncbi:CheR family methyltransferase [Telmatospirillum siberiense]|uniref:Chemotaxis protein methyltransferase n=1 Tax=Telmatospirillum siberiense TaxID=382514 RepID=A0A2N3PQ97_9PROT|nr:CheR family methyltransferase [Telmatospirillum siberiense]PKU22576.1 chemotaxis protein CheR [Telmatospirillum siberiense]